MKLFLYKVAGLWACTEIIEDVNNVSNMAPQSTFGSNESYEMIFIFLPIKRGFFIAPQIELARIISMIISSQIWLIQSIILTSSHLSSAGDHQFRDKMFRLPIGLGEGQVDREPAASRQTQQGSHDGFHPSAGAVGPRAGATRGPSSRSKIEPLVSPAGQQPAGGQRAEAVDHRGAGPAGQEALLLRAVPGRHAVRTHHQQASHRHRLLGRALRVQQPARRPQPPPSPIQGDGQEETQGNGRL